MSDRAPTTLRELKAHLVEIGHDPDGVADAADREAARVEGMSLFRALPDGRYQVTGWERGVEYDARTYPSEAAAVQAVAASYDNTPVPTGRVRTTEERRADGRRMQERAQEMLRRIEAAQDTKQHRGE